MSRLLNRLAPCGGVGSHRPTGRETLENGGEWQCPTNSLHRFFKVVVEMPWNVPSRMKAA